MLLLMDEISKTSIFSKEFYYWMKPKDAVKISLDSRSHA